MRAELHEERGVALDGDFADRDSEEVRRIVEVKVHVAFDPTRRAIRA